MPKMLLAAYATGIILAYFSAPWENTGLCLTAGALFLLWGLLYKTHASWVPFLGMLCLTGFIQTQQQLNAPGHSQHISYYATTSDVAVGGIVLSAEERAEGGYKVLVEAMDIFPENGPRCTVGGKLLLFVKEGLLRVLPGQVIKWRSKLRKPSRFGNPGEFNYPLYLASQDIYVTAFVRQANDIATIKNHPDTQLSVIKNLRRSLGQRIRATVPESESSLLQSLLLGLRSGITSDQRQVLADSGLAHLFAISGLHFGLLALLLYQTGKYLYSCSQRLMLWLPPQRILPLIIIFPLAGYLLLTGSAWATRRAFIMVTAVALLFVVNRRTSPFNLLALTALLLLVFNPLALFQPGFQLSFAGVLGILLIMPAVQKRTKKLKVLYRWPLLLFLTTFSATLATAPVMLWHFHQFTHAGLVTNMVAIPLIAWGAVPTGLCGLAVGVISAGLAEHLLLLSGFLVSQAIDFARFIEQWPVLKAVPVYLTISNLLLLYGLLFLLFPVKSWQQAWPVKTAILLLLAITSWFITPENNSLKLSAFSVGQGDATLISIEEMHYLVDGGGLPHSSIDPGEDLIAPALGRSGVKQLEGVIATHNHPDHCSGLAFILSRFPVKKFYYAGDLSGFPSELQQAIDQYRIKTVQLSAGWTTIFSDNKRTMRLFVPDQQAQDINERSIFTYVRDSNDGILLSADAGTTALRQLLATGFSEPVSILKLPHHGSRHSQPEMFLSEFTPSISFVSTGTGNAYGFPHAETLAACQKYNSILYRTDWDGLLVFHLGQENIVTTFNQRQRPFSSRSPGRLYN